MEISKDSFTGNSYSMMKKICLIGYLLLLTLVSCQNDELASSVPNYTATFTLNFGNAIETRGPLTRAVDDNAITNVDVISFKVDPSAPTDITKGTYFYRVRGVYNPTTQKVQVQLIGDVTSQTLVLVANLRQQFNMLNASYGEQKETVMNRLLLPATTNGQPDFTNGMPMWGELVNQPINSSYVSTESSPKEVKMIRSVSKFTLQCPNASPYHFFSKIDGVYLYNYRNKGRVSPDNYTPATTTVTTPTVPTGATVTQGTHFTLLAPGTSDILEGTERSFYLFEADNKTKYATDPMDATCLVVHIHFASNDQGKLLTDQGWPNSGYYRIDFKDYTTDAVLDLLRNHHYTIRVESIDGLPAATADKAYEGNHTIKCKIVPWNDVQENVSVTFNSRLKVDKSNVILMKTGSQNLTITTENTSGWKIDSYPNWLTITGGTQITTDTQTTLTLHAATSGFRFGVIKLTAGRMTLDIKVSQAGKLPLEYVAEYNIAGGAQFFGTAPNNVSATSAQTDLTPRWSASYSNDQSGYYNGYVAGNNYHSTYNPNHPQSLYTTFSGYHLPSIQEWVGIFGYGNTDARYGLTTIHSGTGSEAVEFGGRKHTFDAEIKTSAGTSIGYALRFKKGTGTSAIGSLTDYPHTADNSMLCAYRYEPIGDWTSGNNGSRLRVQCVFLGYYFSGDINTICDEAWWSARSAETITREFPIPGVITTAVPGTPSTLNDRGTKGYYWSKTPDGTTGMRAVSIGDQQATANATQTGEKGITIRLFSDN